MDPNWIMAIIAIAAILSPTIVSIIDNIFKYKSKKLELSYVEQRNALNNFVNSAMHYYPKASFNDVIKYETSKNSLYSYFHNVPDEEISKLEVLATESNIAEYKKTLSIISNKLSSQIGK